MLGFRLVDQQSPQLHNEHFSVIIQYLVRDELIQ